MARNPWIFGILSTDYDLHDVRQELISMLKDKGVLVSAFETPDFPAEPDMHSHASCLSAVTRLDVAIILIDKRYGGQFFGAPDISITEKEYLTVMENGKPYLIFVTDKAWEERHTYREKLKKSGKTEEDFDREYKCTYVDKVQVIHFLEKIQRMYETNGNSNWITKYNDIVDLKRKVNGKLEGLSRYFLSRIIKRQEQRIRARKTSTSFSMSLGDIIDNNYYLEPSYEIASGNLKRLSEEPLENRIVSSLEEGASILIDGEAGYGKTTILAKSFLKHVDKLMRNNDYSMPFYLWLKSKSGSYHFDYNTYLDECFEEYLQKENYPYLNLDSVRPFFYLDGFDEIAEKLSIDEVRNVTVSEMFKYPVLLTCRKQYAHRYISSSDFANKFDIRIDVQSWTKEKAEDYIRNFCEIRGEDGEYTDKVRTLLMNSEQVSHILDSPLLVTMFLWIIEENRIDVKSVRSRVELFRDCIRMMAMREADRGFGDQITSKDAISDMILLWSYFAWLFYENKLEMRTVSVRELLQDLQRVYLPRLGERYNESLFEAVFDMAGDRVYGTFHEQFLEYLVANTLYHACMEKCDPYPEFLKYIMRPEINRNFREMWSDDTRDNKANVENALIEQYKENLGSDSNEAVSKRVHAIYHISRLASDKRQEFLDWAFRVEDNTSVKLSLYFGAIKMGNLEKEEEFYHLLISSKEYDEANRGYHLMYYTDANLGNSFPYLDDGKSPWGKTLDAFVRHFESRETAHYYLRRIDLVTMRFFIQSRNSVEPLDDSIMAQLDTLVNAPVALVLEEFRQKVISEWKEVRSIYKTLYSGQ